MLDGWLDQLEHAPDEYEQLRLVSTLGEYPRLNARSGQKPNWAKASHDINTVRDRLKAVRELGAKLASAVTQQTRAPPGVGDRAVHTRGGARTATRRAARVPRPPRARA